jgi:hypothetical protein
MLLWSWVVWRGRGAGPPLPGGPVSASSHQQHTRSLSASRHQPARASLRSTGSAPRAPPERPTEPTLLRKKRILYLSCELFLTDSFCGASSPLYGRGVAVLHGRILHRGTKWLRSPNYEPPMVSSRPGCLLTALKPLVMCVGSFLNPKSSRYLGVRADGDRVMVVKGWGVLFGKGGGIWFVCFFWCDLWIQAFVWDWHPV